MIYRYKNENSVHKCNIMFNKITNPHPKQTTFNSRSELIIYKKRKNRTFKVRFLFGAGDRGRTDTVSLPLDFESSTSANSITPAFNKWYCIIFLIKNQVFFYIFLKIIVNIVDFNEQKE